MPVGLGVVGISVALPCGDFLDEGLFIGNPTVKALGRQDAEFGALPDQANCRALECSAIRSSLDQSPGLGGWKRLP